MLKEDCKSFSSNEEDIDCVPDLVEINLRYNHPLQKKYTSIHQPLYLDVKQFIEDLLNQNFITSLPTPLMLSAFQRNTGLFVYRVVKSLVHCIWSGQGIKASRYHQGFLIIHIVTTCWNSYYYRRHIKNFSRTAKPIYDLLTATEKDRQTHSKTPICRGKEQPLALEELMASLRNPPIMA